jgi:hypothetical protein
MDLYNLARENVQGYRERESIPWDEEKEAPLQTLKRLVKEMKETNDKFIKNPLWLIYPDAFTSEKEEDTTNPDLN